MVDAKVLFLVCFVGVCYCEEPSNFEAKIIGGHQVTIERVPYMASLRISTKNGMTHLCGGSIINKRFILTAAHCIKPNRKYEVRVGTNRINNKNKKLLYAVEKIIMNEGFSRVTYNYDICLIKLARDLVFNKRVAPIKLADKNFKLPQNVMLNVTGWGSTGKNKYSSHLLQVTVPFVRQKQCQSQYEGSGLEITPQMLCAGTKGKDSCQGDSGGPLTKGDVQVGITSFGLNCGKVPGVYVKVSALLPWITSQMKRN